MYNLPLENWFISASKILKVFALFSALKLTVINSLFHFKVNIWGELLLSRGHLQQRHHVREVRGQAGQHHQPVYCQVCISISYLPPSRVSRTVHSFVPPGSSSTWSLSQTFSFRFSTSTPGAVRLDFNNKIFTNNKNRKR